MYLILMYLAASELPNITDVPKTRMVESVAIDPAQEDTLYGGYLIVYLTWKRASFKTNVLTLLCH